MSLIRADSWLAALARRTACRPTPCATRSDAPAICSNTVSSGPSTIAVARPLALDVPARRSATVRSSRAMNRPNDRDRSATSGW
jgi:hypothetical protein